MFPAIAPRTAPKAAPTAMVHPANFRLPAIPILQFRFAALGGTAEGGRPDTSSPDPSLRFRQFRLRTLVSDLPDFAEQF